MKTTTTCSECGAEIAEALIGDALCTECRYDKRRGPRPLAHDAEEDRRGFRIIKPGIPEADYDQHPLFAHYYADSNPEGETQASYTLAILDWLLRFIVEGGTRDGAFTRAHAALFLNGRYASQADAARAAGVSEVAMCKAVRLMREELAKLSGPEES